MLSATDTVILAGGRGTRLAEALPDGWPKALAPIRGRPFLAYLLDHLYRYGVRRVTLCLGYGAAHVEDFLARRPAPDDLTIRLAIESHPLGTGGALRQAMTHVRSDPFLALNGDTYADCDLDDLLASHVRTRADITMALARGEHAAGCATAVLDSHGRITQFSARTRKRGKGFANAGIYAIRAAVISCLPPAGYVSWEQDILPRHAGQGLYGRVSCRRFVDIGTPGSLRRAASWIALPRDAAR